MITGSCPITMCKSKAVPKEEPKVEVETTNVGFVNLSESAVSTIGIGEIISTIILVMIIGMIIRWCCKRYTKSRAASQRNLEEMIRQNAGMQGTGPSALIFAAQQPPAGMIPMVTIRNPSERRINFAQPASHWEACK